MAVLRNDAHGNRTTPRTRGRGLSLRRIVLVVVVAATFAVSAPASDSAADDAAHRKAIDSIRSKLHEYKTFPQRSKHEAAVLEWGHSAIISALDASVAEFGPQTSDAALLEVEAMPILAQPIGGIRLEEEQQDDEEEEEEVEEEEDAGATAGETEDGGGEAADVEEKPKKKHKKEKKKKERIRPLDNAEEVHGNVVVMTMNPDAADGDDDSLSGLEMAQVAQLSGAAALLIVNLDEHHPEDIYRLTVDSGDERQRAIAEEIQIPVVMVSLNSANALTSATVTPETKQHEIVNNGMPERVRLYAGGDRPFFEDVEAMDPTLYLIHNLLTDAECDALVRQANPAVRPLSPKADLLQMTIDPAKFYNVERVMLWQGQLQSPAAKAIEERIEQVTGFPANHFSDFVVDRLNGESFWLPHLDAGAESSGGPPPPVATITVFLTEPSSGSDNDGDDGSFELVFPETKSGEPIRIRPVKGLAVVHHNTDENQHLDISSVHALLPPLGEGPMYVARKFIYNEPVSNARRTAVPAFAFLFGGRLPSVVVMVHDILVERFGYDTGGRYFDKLCVFMPALIGLALAQWLVDYVRRHIMGDGGGEDSDGKDKQQNLQQQQTPTRNNTATKKESGGSSPVKRTKKRKQ